MNPVPIPISDAIARPPRKEYLERKAKDPQEGMVTQPWVDFFTDQEQLGSLAPSRVVEVDLTAQDASIAATDMTGGTLPGGWYRLTYYFRITTAASVSSSLQLTIDWNEGGVTPSFTGVAETGNTTTTYQTGTLFFPVTNLSAVRYSTTYASVGTPMDYLLHLNLEAINA